MILSTFSRKEIIENTVNSDFRQLFAEWNSIKTIYFYENVNNLIKIRILIFNIKFLYFLKTLFHRFIIINQDSINGIEMFNMGLEWNFSVVFGK